MKTRVITHEKYIDWFTVEKKNFLNMWVYVDSHKSKDDAIYHAKHLANPEIVYES